MIILSEYSSSLKKSAGADYLKRMEDAAKLIAIDIINYKQNNLASLEEALYYKPSSNQLEKVFWLGFVPSDDTYIKVNQVLKGKNLELINTHAQFSRSEYFDQFYPFIKDYTIESDFTSDINEAKQIAKKLGYPLFLKGTIQSLKKFGWSNCVANNEKELEEIFRKLKLEEDFSLGKIIIRKLVKLKHHEIGGNGIPKAHEYRFFVLNEKVVDYSFYWNGENPFSLSPSELNYLNKLVLEIANKIKVPFFSIDVGETVDEGWKVIEIGDGQFSDIRNISPLKFWNQIKEI